jgi:acetate kinase
MQHGSAVNEIVRGSISSLFTPKAKLTISGVQASQSIKAATMVEAMSSMLDSIQERIELKKIGAIAHRIVHGGDISGGAVSLTAEILDKLGTISELAPLHIPRSLELVEASKATLPDALQVAVFDTSFHFSLPPVARTLPLSARIREGAVRRYGFHGISYTYSMRELVRTESDAARRSRVIVAHLGSGSSLAAIKDGKSVDTTMSFSPLGGIMMATRCGDIDPGIILYLSKYKKLPIDEIVAELMTKSGLVGVGGTNDMRELLNRRADHDDEAALAVEMFTYRVAQQIGAYSVTLDGLDTLVFTGGIGENSAVVRRLICERLKILGVTLDPKANESNSGIISGTDSPVRVRVVYADEEMVLAEEAFKLYLAR